MVVEQFSTTSPVVAMGLRARGSYLVVLILMDRTRRAREVAAAGAHRQSIQLHLAQVATAATVTTAAGAVVAVVAGRGRTPGAVGTEDLEAVGVHPESCFREWEARQ